MHAHAPDTAATCSEPSCQLCSGLAEDPRLAELDALIEQASAAADAAGCPRPEPETDVPQDIEDWCGVVSDAAVAEGLSRDAGIALAARVVQAMVGAGLLEMPSDGTGHLELHTCSTGECDLCGELAASCAMMPYEPFVRLPAHERRWKHVCPTCRGEPELWAEACAAGRAGEQEANAALISAAPKLLAACRAAHDMLFGWGLDSEGNSVLSELAAAIAEAEGGEQ